MLIRTAQADRTAAAILGCATVLVLAACAGPVSAPVTERGEPGAPGTAAVHALERDIQETPDAHVVAGGDTLYSIAWRYGHDYRSIARWNGISDPYVIYPGQSLRLQPAATTGETPTRAESVPAPAAPRSATPHADEKPETKEKTAGAVTTPAPGSEPAIGSTGPIVWRWPTEGKIVQSDAPTSKKGLDIAGRLGQSIHAAAHGAVVYSGSGLLGYGRLIIIKHSDTYLSAYAHNDSVLVKEGDRVASGQQIATMGRNSGSSRPTLHFEIRKDGLPVNPLSYLPRRSA